MNLQYYAQHSFDKYPDKEIFGIRVTNEWEDMIGLDKLLGGSGMFQQEGKSQFHGNAKAKPHAPAQLSVEATHKLRCILWKELDLYRSVWGRALNFNSSTKRDNEAYLESQCGVSSGWKNWTQQCRHHLDEDDKVLKGLRYP